MEVIKALLSFLSYVFHGLLCLILLAMAGLAMAAGAQTLHLGMLPWTGSTLLYTLFFGAMFGLLTVILFGLLVENLIFRTIAQRTVRRWGMHS